MRSTRGETKPFLASKFGKVVWNLPWKSFRLRKFGKFHSRVQDSEPPMFEVRNLSRALIPVDMCHQIIDSGRPTIWEKGHMIMKG
jgi:hypothetical protein